MVGLLKLNPLYSETFDFWSLHSYAAKTPRFLQYGVVRKARQDKSNGAEFWERHAAYLCAVTTARKWEQTRMLDYLNHQAGNGEGIPF